MKHANAKKILLVTLSAVAIYIWWGNIETFQSSEAGYLTMDEIADDAIRPKSGGAPIAYEEPRVNPFKRELVTEEPARSRSSRPRPTSPPVAQTPPLSSKYFLKGIILEKQTPQAVVQTDRGSSRVISLNDSLEVWKLTEIGDRFAIFCREKAYDTLWLDGVKP